MNRWIELTGGLDLKALLSLRVCTCVSIYACVCELPDDGQLMLLFLKMAEDFLHIFFLPKIFIFLSMHFQLVCLLCPSSFPSTLHPCPISILNCLVRPKCEGQCEGITCANMIGA